MGNHKEYAREALGAVFPPEEVPATNCYAYPNGYGKPAESAEEIADLREDPPSYPTISALEVDLTQLSGGAFEVRRARRVDTTTPGDNTDWVEMPQGEQISLCNRCRHREVSEQGEVCEICEQWEEEGL